MQKGMRIETDQITNLPTDRFSDPAKNFSHLLPEINKLHETKVIDIYLIDDNPENPRGEVQEEDPQFIELTASLEADGLLEPVPVTPLGNGRYRLVGGHRRKRGAIKLKWTKISCTVIENISKSQEIALMLAENLHRRDLTYTQEARGYAGFLKEGKKEGKTLFDLVRALQVGLEQIKSRLTLLKLIPAAQSLIDRGDLLLGHGKQLARLTPEQQNSYMARAQTLTVKKFEKLVGKLLEPKSGDTDNPRRMRKRAETYKVLGEKEQFTRSWAVSKLTEAKEKKFTAKNLLYSLDDICQDACLEEKSELACLGCPVPRLVASLLKRAEPEEENAKLV